MIFIKDSWKLSKLLLYSLYPPEPVNSCDPFSMFHTTIPVILTAVFCTLAVQAMPPLNTARVDVKLENSVEPNALIHRNFVGRPNLQGWSPNNPRTPGSLQPWQNSHQAAPVVIDLDSSSDDEQAVSHQFEEIRTPPAKDVAPPAETNAGFLNQNRKPPVDFEDENELRNYIQLLVQELNVCMEGTELKPACEKTIAALVAWKAAEREYPDVEDFRSFEEWWERIDRALRQVQGRTEKEKLDRLEAVTNGIPEYTSEEIMTFLAGKHSDSESSESTRTMPVEKALDANDLRGYIGTALDSPDSPTLEAFHTGTVQKSLVGGSSQASSPRALGDDSIRSKRPLENSVVSDNTRPTKIRGG